MEAVLKVANDRGAECYCCWIVVNLWIVVAGFGSSWFVVQSLWVIVGSLWVVPCFSNYRVVTHLQ